jgi:uncharacterized protein YcnI
VIGVRERVGPSNRCLRRTAPRSLVHSVKLLAGGSAAGLMLILGASVAGAHVTVDPSSVPRGTGDVVLTFRVPNEMTNANTVGLRVEFPTDHPIAVVSPEAGSTWSERETMVTLKKSVTTDDGTFTSVVSEIDWSGGKIPPEQFAEFNVLAQGIPSNASQLTFKVLQQYDNGVTVAWIEVPSRADPDPAHPAPVLLLTSAGGATSPAVTSVATPVAPAAGGQLTTGNSDGAAVLAIIVAGFAVALGVLAVWLARPKTRSDLVAVEPEGSTARTPVGDPP